MLTRLHLNAALSPGQRRAIRRSALPVAKLAVQYNISATTVRRWRGRDDPQDRSSATHATRSVLSELQEAALAALRGYGLSLDDAAEVMRRTFGQPFSRSCIYRGVKRLERAGRLVPPAKRPRAPHGVFEPTAEPGFLHVDVKVLPRLGGWRSYVYVAIDRATRFVWAEVLTDMRSATAAGFLRRVVDQAAAAGIRVRVVLSDNGFEWTDCRARGRRRPSGQHAVDRVCAELGIEHRLTRVRHPQTNGMVERFNRRLSEAFDRAERIKANSGRNCFATHAERDAFVGRLVFNYNRTRQVVLRHRSPWETLQNLTNLTKRYIIAEFFRPRVVNGLRQNSAGEKISATSPPLSDSPPGAY